MSWDEIALLAKELERLVRASSRRALCGTKQTFYHCHRGAAARAAFTRVTARVRKEVSIPVITSNQINMPEVAEEVLERGDADLVSMARPMLADSEFMNKAATGRETRLILYRL